MKIFKYSLLLVAIVCLSCKDDKKASVNAVSKNEIIHYICDNKCENSGSAIAGNCPTCQKPYTHNQAFHDKDFMKSGPLNIPKDNSLNSANAPAQAAPARNAKGVYHYTCTNGCNGGGASATDCTVCGNALVHNTAYHE